MANSQFEGSDATAEVRDVAPFPDASELETPSGEGEESTVPGSAEELFGPGNRAGIPGTLHRITSVRATAGITGRHRIIGLTYHVKRHVPGAPPPARKLWLLCICA